MQKSRPPETSQAGGYVALEISLELPC